MTAVGASRAADDPGWLAPEEQQMWRALVSAVAEASWALGDQLQRDGGLSFIEYSTLAMLSDAPGQTLRMGELARFTHASLSRLSHLVKRLEGRGLIARARDRTNGRYVTAVLTDDGRALLARVAPEHVRAVRHIVLDRLEPGQLRTIARAALSVRDPLIEPRPTT